MQTPDKHNIQPWQFQNKAEDKIQEVNKKNLRESSNNKLSYNARSSPNFQMLHHNIELSSILLYHRHIKPCTD
jgi:hypothetical protein